MTKQNEKDAKRVPELRFKGFTDDWEQVEFGHKIYRRTKSEMSSSKLPGVEYEDINSGQGTLNKDITKKSIRKKGIFFQPFDVLFGKLRPYLKNWLYPNFKGVAVGDFWVLYSKLLEPSFIYGMIQTQKFQNVANLSSGSKMPRSDWKLVSGTLFRFPMNENEQRKIGLLLLNLDKTITLHEEKHRQLEQLKKALLQKMFADETGYPALRFKRFSTAWEQHKLSKLTTKIGTGKSKYKLQDNGRYPILGSTSVIGYDNNFDYTGDFILTARVGANAGNLYRFSGSVKITDNTVFIKSKYNKFLYYYLQKYDLKKLSFGTGQPLVKASDLKNLKILKPRLDEEIYRIGRLQ
ncbi:restriction endonuclease subunit S [Limosilactobacillus pulli]|uniref:restriction endonuclease subunit S n=1 Tax=Limosilactobacillus pulli TaxID=2991833 RepID=UPI0024BA8045|nr:restriction endonuclease subunit S [Limosilactobacillus pulli]